MKVAAAGGGCPQPLTTIQAGLQYATRNHTQADLRRVCNTPLGLGARPIKSARPLPAPAEAPAGCRRRIADVQRDDELDRTPACCTQAPGLRRPATASP